MARLRREGRKVGRPKAFGCKLSSKKGIDVIVSVCFKVADVSDLITEDIIYLMRIMGVKRGTIVWFPGVEGRIIIAERAADGQVMTMRPL